MRLAFALRPAWPPFTNRGDCATIGATDKTVRRTSAMKNHRSGQTMVEYIIIVVVIAIAALAVFGLFGDAIREKVGGATSSLTTTDIADKAQDAASGSSASTLRSMDVKGVEIDE